MKKKRIYPFQLKFIVWIFVLLFAAALLCLIFFLRMGGKEKTALEVEEDMIQLSWNEGWSQGISIVFGIPLICHYSDWENFYYPEGEEFYCSFTAEDGEFHIIQEGQVIYLGKEVLVQNGSALYWNNHEGDFARFSGKFTYVDVIVRTKDHIVGYAVIKMNNIYWEENDPGMVFKAQIIKSAMFPQINNKYQDISEDFVIEQMNLVKEKITPSSTVPD